MTAVSASSAPAVRAGSPAWLDRMYNNRALVPDHGEYFARWAAESARVRATERCTLDVRYGEQPGETLDVFPAGPNAPVVVFIHGGYWRSLDKSDHSFLAPVFTQAGACVVVPNYDLCPQVTIPDIVMQMVRALAWTWRSVAQWGGDARRVVVVGHSAGGHLAAQLLCCDWKAVGADLPARWLRQALSISGLYDLDPIRRTPFLQSSLQLTPAQVRRASPAWLPAPAGRLYTVAGGDESAEFIRHNHLIRAAWGRRAVPVCEDLPGLNHFSIVEAMAQPGHRLNDLALQLLAQA